MRILHVIAGMAPEYGGPSKAGYELCRALASLGHDVGLYTTNITPQGSADVPTDRPLVADGFELRYFPVGRPRAWTFSWDFARGIQQAIGGYDIVHIHGMYNFPTAIAGHYARKARVPYVLRPHGNLDPFMLRKNRLRKSVYHLLVEKRNLNCAAAIHYTSRDEMDLAHRALGIRAPGVVVPLGLELSEYATLPRPGAFQAKYPETQDKQLILFLGRLNFKKGLDLLAKAYATVAREHRAAHLVIAGPDDGLGEQARRWLAAEGVLDRVTFTGMLKGQDKLAALTDADVFVLPSYSENFGVAVAEAMACGLPVVISNKVNIWKEVVDAGAGIATSCDARQLSDALSEMLSDAGRRARLGEHGRRLVARSFAWDRVAAQMLRVYQNV